LVSACRRHYRWTYYVACRNIPLPTAVPDKKADSCTKTLQK